MASSKTDPVLALCAEYFFACQVLRDHLKEIDPEIEKQFLADPEGIDPHVTARFQTYVNHWLSSLFVVAEAFRDKLKLNDKVITQLPENDDNLMYRLRKFRDRTYHFHFRRQSDTHFLSFMTHPDSLSWAETLHLEFERYFREYTESLPNDDKGRRPAQVH